MIYLFGESLSCIRLSYKVSVSLLRDSQKKKYPARVALRPLGREIFGFTRLYVLRLHRRIDIGNGARELQMNGYRKGFAISF